MIPLYRKLIALAIVLALVVLTGSVLLEQPAWCVSADGSPVGCAEITLIPSEATGDFYVDGALVAPALNIGQLALAPDVDHTIEVKNIQSTEADLGTLFSYKDVSMTLKVKAGEAKVKTVKLVKNYIRGTLELTCDIKNYAGENLACSVAIDGAAQPAALAAGQKASYILDPGSHAVTVSLSGDPAQIALWAPASLNQTVSITAGAKLKKMAATFKKAGHLIVTFNQPTVIGDFYVNGELVGQQVPAIDKWLGAGSYQVKVQNIQDAALPGYRWRLDQSVKTVRLTAGQENKAVFKLRVDTAAVQKGVNELCKTGIGVIETPMFAGGPGPHPIRAYNDGGGVHAWAGSIQALASGPFEATQMVVCIGPQQSVEIERCNYTDGHQAIRYRYVMNARLMASHNNQGLAGNTFVGSEPKGCPDTKAWGSTLTLQGNRVTLQQVLDWLRPWAKP